MKFDLVDRVYEGTIDLLESKLKDSEYDYKTLFRQNLEKSFRPIIEDFMKDTVNMQDTRDIDEFIKIEIEFERRKWQGLTKDEMLSYLIQDDVFEYLRFKADVAYNRALKCRSEQKFFNNEDEYRQEMSDFLTAESHVKPFNKVSAESLYSEFKLNIDYAYRKSDAMSFGLSHILVDKR